MKERGKLYLASLMHIDATQTQSRIDRMDSGNNPPIKVGTSC